MKVPAVEVVSALDLYYRGMSVQEICQHLKELSGSKHSKATVYGWIEKFTDIAVQYFRDKRPTGIGDEWVTYVSSITMNKGRLWLWDIIDAKTRFLLASHVSPLRASLGVAILIRQAINRAGKKPKVVYTDKLAPYVGAALLDFAGAAEYSQHSSFDVKTAVNVIDRCHCACKERINGICRLHDIESVARFTDGFQVYYNFLRPHDALDGRSPAKVAGVVYDAEEWDSLCRLPVSKEQELPSHKNSSHQTTNGDQRTSGRDNTWMQPAMSVASRLVPGAHFLQPNT